MFRFRVDLYVFWVLCSIVILFGTETSGQQCNPQDFKVLSLTKCDPNSIVEPGNFTSILNKDCTFTYKGCLRIRKEVHQVKGKAEIHVGNMKIPIKSDVCIDFTKPRKLAGVVLKSLDLGCPFKQGLHCPKGRLDIAKQMSQMGIKGEYTLILSGNHENNDKSCMEMKCLFKN